MSTTDKLVLGIVVLGTVLITKIITDRYNEINKIANSVEELYYYVQEDVNNGNLNEDIKWVYIKELEKISTSINELQK